MNNIIYFDAFNGVSGDMILGALIDLGMPLCHLQAELGKMDLEGYSLSAEKVKRQSMFGINFQVKVEHQQEHSHGHHHHRGFNEIRKLIESSSLDDWIKEKTVRIFRRLGEAEAKVHHSTIEDVHFHGNTTRINDNGTTTLFTEMFLGVQAQIVAPDDVAGVLVVSAAGANNWSAAAVQIRAASATPFKLVGMSFECAIAEKTGIRLFSDGGTVPIFQTLVETGAAVARHADITSIEEIWVNQGLAIHARVKSEAGNNNVLIWIHIKPV